MAFVTKTWKDRLVEYAGRRKLKNVATGEEILMDVSRSEGTVNQAGDAFSAANMNNLEQRIKTEFDSVNSSLGVLKFGIDSDGNYGYIKDGADTVTPFKSGFIIPYAAGSRDANTNVLDLRLNVEGYNKLKFDYHCVIVFNPYTEIYGSNDGINYNIIKHIQHDSDWKTVNVLDIELNIEKYKYIKLYWSSAAATGGSRYAYLENIVVS